MTTAADGIAHHRRTMDPASSIAARALLTYQTGSEEPVAVIGSERRLCRRPTWGRLGGGRRGPLRSSNAGTSREPSGGRRSLWLRRRAPERLEVRPVEPDLLPVHELVRGALPPFAADAVQDVSNE